MDISTVGSIIVLLILIIAVVFGIRKSLDKKELERFLNGLGDKVLEITIETIKNMNPDGFTDFDVFCKLVLDNIYNSVWDYVSLEAQEALQVDQITKTIFKMVDKETVVKFIDEIFKDKENRDLYNAVWDAYAAERIETLDTTDDEFSEEDYFIDETSSVDLAPYTPVDPPQEELDKLIPRVEDDNNDSVDMEDDTVEIITDKKEIVVQKDKNGNTLYYEIDPDGKKTRVSKTYALQFLEGGNNES